MAISYQRIEDRQKAKYFKEIAGFWIARKNGEIVGITRILTEWLTLQLTNFQLFGKIWIIVISNNLKLFLCFLKWIRRNLAQVYILLKRV